MPPRVGRIPPKSPQQRSEVRQTLDRYTTARLVQVAQVGACNRLHPIGNRLVRWILTLRDRIDRDYIHVSQQSMADALGVHRPTIAVELQRLNKTGAIVYRNRMVRIVDRPRLESFACECHTALHREYVNLFRPLTSPEAVDPAPDGGVAIDALRNIAGRLLIASLHEQAARERAEAADRAKDDFLAVVSHELRSPLQAIVGWCALSKLPNPPAGAIEVIERNARAQAALIEDLLDSARINANTFRISLREINARGVVESAIENIRPAAEAKQITLRLNVINEPPPVLGDGDRLRQVVINVLMNSVKFSEAGGTVETQLSTGAEATEIRITDQGHGISAEALPHVFERFWRPGHADQGRRHGLGLGLSISRALVELHGGTMALTSQGAGHGTTCTITLPTPPLRPAG